jgi:hypothetical protein
LRLNEGVSLEPRGTIEVRGRGPMRVLLVNEPDQTDGAVPVAETAQA